MYAYFCSMRSHAIFSVFFKKKLNKLTDSKLEINWLHRVVFSFKSCQVEGWIYYGHMFLWTQLLYRQVCTLQYPNCCIMILSKMLVLKRPLYFKAQTNCILFYDSFKQPYFAFDKIGEANFSKPDHDIFF